MATDLERLVVRLEASMKGYENQMKKAGLVADNTAKKIEGRFAKMNKNVNTFGSNFLKGAATGAIGAVLAGINVSAIREAVKGLGDLADLSGKIGVAADEIQALRYAAEQSGGSIEAVDTGLIKFAKNVSDAGRGTGDLYKVLQANGVALRDQAGNLRSSTELFGVYADLVANARSPQDQLNLAVMAFGKAAGPDLVGLLKQGSAGVDALTKQARDVGRVLGNDVVAEADNLDDKLAELEGRLQATFGEFAVSTGPLLVQSLTAINDLVAQIAGALNSWPVQKLDSLLAWAQNGVADSGRAFGEATGLRQTSMELQRRLGINSPAIQAENAAYAGYETQRNAARLGATSAPTAAGPTTKVPTIVPSASFGQTNDYERAVKSIKDRTQAIVAEANAQARLNPLVNDYGFAVEKARAEQDLLTAAMDAGVTITPQLRAQIEGLATGYAAVTADAARLAEQQAELQDSVAQFADIGRTALGGFISDMRDGASAGEALANVLSNIADRMVDIALNSVFDTKSGGGIGSLIGAALSAFGGARASGGPVTAGRSYLVGEKGPEIITPRANGIVVPNAALRKAGGGGSSTVNVTVDLRGTTGDKELDAKIRTSAAAAYSQAMRDAKKNAPGWIAEHQTYRA